MSDTLQSKEAIISELGDILFDALMLEMILRKQYDFGVNEAWDTVATKVERRTPYMKEWGDGVTSAETVEEAEAIWQNVKKKQKQSELEKLGARRSSLKPVEMEENVIDIETPERSTNTSSIYRKLQPITIIIGTLLSKASKVQISHVCTGVIVGYFIGYRLGK
jgi:NTP pyrophosphatase (non-canonical NTP hydrolase)